NYTYGPYNTNTRTIPASEVSSYAFIHEYNNNQSVRPSSYAFLFC
ncbi:MAG: hypothetical protein E7A66_04285, partial [Staphylococcus lugdunensis]|nr:hypothetical protein [Staphylococcus lugdunensis]